MNPLVIATHNEGKVKEFGGLLAGIGIRLISAGSLGLPVPEETESTFEGNARIKSQSAAMLSGHWALADDSGLSITALGGAPGVYSADWAGQERNFDIAFGRIRSELKAFGFDVEGAEAYFTCMLALTSPDGQTQFFEGRIDGMLTDTPSGSGGFGYDPIFIPEGQTKTFAEMKPAEKNAISHRARAFAKFLAHIAANRKKVAS